MASRKLSLAFAVLIAAHAINVGCSRNSPRETDSPALAEQVSAIDAKLDKLRAELATRDQVAGIEKQVKVLDGQIAKMSQAIQSAISEGDDATTSLADDTDFHTQADLDGVLAKLGRTPRAEDIADALAEIANLAAKNMAVEEQQGGESLILPRGADLFLYRHVLGREVGDLG
ncbi:MAG: hypothetical protein NUV77_24865, partial [Thermoguttaceae bacterium]|nr:hypothetical protein [Thermoguttaceae bacterium]